MREKQLQAPEYEINIVSRTSMLPSSSLESIDILRMRPKSNLF